MYPASIQFYPAGAVSGASLALTAGASASAHSGAAVTVQPHSTQEEHPHESSVVIGTTQHSWFPQAHGQDAISLGLLAGVPMALTVAYVAVRERFSFYARLPDRPDGECDPGDFEQPGSQLVQVAMPGSDRCR